MHKRQYNIVPNNVVVNENDTMVSLVDVDPNIDDKEVKL